MDKNFFSVYVRGTSFCLIFATITMFAAFVMFPKLSQNAFQASLVSTETLSDFSTKTVPFLGSLIQFIIFTLIVSGFSFIIMTMLLKMEAKKILYSSKKNTDIWKKMGEIPSISIIEVLAFVWVLGWLILSVLLLVYIFDGNMNFLADATKIETNVLFRMSLIFGLLGGSLSSIKFFIPSGSKIKVFHIGYTFKYLANPFFSSVIGFLSYLLFMNLQWFGLNYSDKQINVLALVFVFTLVGYFSEYFISLLYALVKKFSEWLEKSFALELGEKIN